MKLKNLLSLLLALAMTAAVLTGCGASSARCGTTCLFAETPCESAPSHRAGR